MERMAKKHARELHIEVEKGKVEMAGELKASGRNEAPPESGMLSRHTWALVGRRRRRIQGYI